MDWVTNGRRVITAGWLLLVLHGCSSGSARGERPDATTGVDRPGLSDPRAAICAEVDAGGPVSYAIVQQIFDLHCVSCHAVGADLVLGADVAWNNLVNQAAPAAESCGGTLVVPGNPSASFLFQKLASPSPCSGLQMPRGELGSEPLPACVVDLISRWIEEGAPGPGSSPPQASPRLLKTSARSTSSR